MKLFARVLVCLLALGILTASFAGCGKKADDTSKTTTSKTTTTK